jgi:hypothetical protein
MNEHIAGPFSQGCASPEKISQRTSLVGRAESALCRAERAGAILYDRRRDLARLIHLDPFKALPDTAEATDAILVGLRRALRAERNRGRAGHWTYDLNRHIALRQAYAAEVAGTSCAKTPPAVGASA